MNEYTFSLTHCPGCQSEYSLPSEEEFIICQCGLTFSNDDPLEPINSIWKKFGEAELYWYTDCTCNLFTCEEDNTGIELEWVPFDITEEQVRLYLTFQ